MKVLFVRKLATAVTEELLEKTFSQFGKLERVKKLKDYAFVHFEERDAAVKVILEIFLVKVFWLFENCVTCNFLIIFVYLFQGYG